MNPENRHTNDQENSRKANVDYAKLILCNDDENSFDFVIQNLMDLCEFEYIQAEQIAILAHFTGKATVKVADKLIITSLKEQFEEVGLTVEVV